MQKWKLGIGLALGAVAIVAGVFALQRNTFSLGKPATAAPNPAAFAMPVPVAKIVRKTIPIYLEYAARTEAIRNVALQAKIAGYVQKQHVADGADVKEGDLLYTIDPRDYQAALDSAKAQLQRDTAALDYARGNVERGTTLASNGYLDKNTFEQRTSNLRQSEAGIAIAQAAVRSAEINLSYTEIRAPFSGRLGRNQASVGTLITTGSATLNTLVQLDPVYVTFNPSETDLAAIEQARAKGKVVAEVYLPGDGKARTTGEVTFVDNTVDRSTGTIVARATIANADRSLLPGQYVRIKLAVSERPDALVVPQVALGSSQLGKYVYVVGDGNKVDMRLVSLGPTDGDLVAIDKGIAEGDRVISGNLQKIGPGSLVQPLPPQ
ncbi:MAG: efflux RND transporter periplasmic adaptor subunit [Pseudolabrys sp.]|nr:efflux RND transporter periplasmic adaptor subunit [Pseudolabrys sp.]MDP2296753.1 efflux RND transporter periplasmic adaptor subunit [Pseudolabrys sp.]